LIVGAGSQAYWARTWSWLGDVRRGGLEAVIAALIELNLGRSRIGVVGFEHLMSASDHAALTAGLPEAELADVTEGLDRIRLVKSPEEVALMVETGQIVAQGIHRFREALAPGRTEREVVAEAHQAVRALGCLDGIAHVSTDEPPFIHPPTDRRFTADDIVKFSMEFAGPSGYWIELAGVFSFGQPPEHLGRRFETWQRAFAGAASRMRPGVTGGQLVAEVEEIFRRDGQPVSGRGIWDVHSIGLDVLEPPIVISREDPTILEEGMVLCLHPGLLVGPEGWGVYIQENFAVTPEGGRPLSGLKHEWNVVG
jgi:Xaa-Pro aminopeptidase